MAQSWIIVERFENWEVDAANNFSFFGLSNRYRKTASEITEGDKVFCYVSSGLSSFSDIRVVKEKGFKALKHQSYDYAFPFYISTSPLLTLDRSQWVSIKPIASDLELTRGKTDYRNLFQISIRKVSENDAAFLETKLRAAAEIEVVNPSN